jgi:hypothetical protein
MHFNTKYIFKGDTGREVIGKINYNFDQILSFTVGPDGHQGPIGPTGIYGPAGKRGSSGATGIRASSWYKQPTEPIQNLITNDIWVDTSVSDGDIKVFNYPVANNQWQDSGYSFFNSKYFQSYSYIEGPGGATNNNVIGFKYPGGITGSADTSLLINDSKSSNAGANPNNSKVLISTSDQVDRPIMSFSKNGEVSNDVPSFYWNALGSDAGLKFDSGGSLYATSDLDFSIDSGLARTLITSDSCTFSGENGGFNISGDGDFYFNSNISIGSGAFLNVSSSNLSLGTSSFVYKGSLTISSPLTSTYILDSNPSSPAYNGGISALVKPGVVESFNFSDYTGNSILSNKPSGSVSSGNFAQTIFGSTGGFTGGTGGPFSYHVKKVKEIRQNTTTLSAKNYLTPTSINLTNVFDISTNTNWDIENIIATPTSYSPGVVNNIASYKIGNLDENLNYKQSTATKYGTGFKNGLTGFDQFNGVVNDMVRLSDGSTIFVGNFKVYNEQAVAFGTNVLGICKVNADGTLNTTFKTNVSTSYGLTIQTNGGSVNGILANEPDNRIYVYGAFTYKTNLNSTQINSGIISFDLDGAVDPIFVNRTGVGFSGGSPTKAIMDTLDKTLVLIGSFSKHGGSSRRKLIKLRYDPSSDLQGSVVSAFLSTPNGGFSTSPGPSCLDKLPSGNIIIGGTFSTYFYLTTYSAQNIIEINSTNGQPRASAGLTSMTYSLKTPTDFAVTAIKSVPGSPGNPDSIYIGGSFSDIGGNTCNRIARFTTGATNTSDGSFALDTGYSAGTGFDDVIYDFIQDSNSNLYVGGRFTKYRGTYSPGFIRLSYSGLVDYTVTTDHNLVNPKTIQPAYEYSLGLVRKMYLNSSTGDFIYVGGFLNSTFSLAGTGDGIYLKLPSSVSSLNGYAPVYKDNTTTNYRIFINDISNNINPHYIRGIVFDTGLPAAATTSYVNFSQAGLTGCQYVDLMWASKSSTANLSPRLFYKNCQGISGYVDFGLTGVYSVNGPITINTGQPVTVSWSFSGSTNRDIADKGKFAINKNGTSPSTEIYSTTKSSSGDLPCSVGDKIYVTVTADRGLSASNLDYAKLTISKTSTLTGFETVIFQKDNTAGEANVNNGSAPVTLESGYLYNIVATAQSDSFFFADNILSDFNLF